MIQSPLLRADIEDLSPGMQLAIVEEVVTSIEAKEPSARSRVEFEELPRLRDFQTHLKLNIQRARAQHPWTPKGPTIACPKCGHLVNVV